MFDTIISAFNEVITFLWRYSTADFESLALGTAAILVIYFGRKELSKTLVQDQVLKRLNDISEHNQELASLASGLASKYRDVFSKNAKVASPEILNEWIADVQALNSSSHKCDGRVKAFCMLQRDLAIRVRESDEKITLLNKQVASFAAISFYRLESLCQTLISPKSNILKGHDASSLLSELQKDYFTTQDDIQGPIAKMFWELLDESSAPISWRSEYAKILSSNIAFLALYLETYEVYFPPVLVYTKPSKDLPPFHLISIEPRIKIDHSGQYKIWKLTYQNIVGNVKIGNHLSTFIPDNYTAYPDKLNISKDYIFSVESSNGQLQRITYKLSSRSFNKRTTRIKSRLNRIYLKLIWRKLLSKCNKPILH